MLHLRILVTKLGIRFLTTFEHLRARTQAAALPLLAARSNSGSRAAFGGGKMEIGVKESARGLIGEVDYVLNSKSRRNRDSLPGQESCSAPTGG